MQEQWKSRCMRWLFVFIANAAKQYGRQLADWWGENGAMDAPTCVHPVAAGAQGHSGMKPRRLPRTLGRRFDYRADRRGGQGRGFSSYTDVWVVDGRTKGEVGRAYRVALCPIRSTAPLWLSPVIRVCALCTAAGFQQYRDNDRQGYSGAVWH